MPSARTMDQLWMSVIDGALVAEAVHAGAQQPPSIRSTRKKLTRLPAG